MARKSRVLIVGTAPSLEPVLNQLQELHAGVYTIAVNRALSLIAADAFFSMDPDERQRHDLKQRKAGVHYMMAVPFDYGTPKAECHSHREPAETDIHYLKRIDGIGYSRHVYGLSENPERIHSGNSIYGALNVAYHMRAQKVAILGMDASSEPYVTGLNGRPSSLSHLPYVFSTAIAQLEKNDVSVVTGSMNSFVDCFPQMEPEQALQWLVS